jgi:hypothetical protein
MTAFLVTVGIQELSALAGLLLLDFRRLASLESLLDHQIVDLLRRVLR